jgi:hypothetical protein
VKGGLSLIRFFINFLVFFSILAFIFYFLHLIASESSPSPSSLEHESSLDMDSWMECGRLVRLKGFTVLPPGLYR